MGKDYTPEQCLAKYFVQFIITVTNPIKIIKVTDSERESNRLRVTQQVHVKLELPLWSLIFNLSAFSTRSLPMTAASQSYGHEKTVG